MLRSRELRSRARLADLFALSLIGEPGEVRNHGRYQVAMTGIGVGGTAAYRVST